MTVTKIIEIIERQEYCKGVYSVGNDRLESWQTFIYNLTLQHFSSSIPWVQTNNKPHLKKNRPTGCPFN